MKRLRCILSFVTVLMILLCVFSMTAFADAGGSCGENVTWNLDDAGTLTISGTGRMERAPWKPVYRDDIKKAVIKEGVTSVCDRAFSECYGIEEIILPESVTMLGYCWIDGLALDSLRLHPTLSMDNHWKSWGAAKIQNLYISDLEHFIHLKEGAQGDVNFIFYNLYLKDELVKHLVVPAGITLIDYASFNYCKSIEEITIPPSVKTIGQYAFYKCENLKAIHFQGDAPKIYDYSFDGSFTVYYPEGNPTWTDEVKYYFGANAIEFIEEEGHTHYFTETIVEPACETEGYTIYTCDCGYSKTDSYVPAVGHSFTEKITEAACETEGYTTYTCDCGYSKTDSYVPAVGHHFTETTIEATCETEGYTTYTCDCGYSKRDNFVSPGDHQWNDGVVTKQPTTEEEGEKTYACTVCGATEVQSIDKLIEPLFKDVKNDDWFYAPVMWAVDNNITGGIGNGQFGPDNTCTRGQVVTFLWAAAGKPDPTSAKNPFTDVSSSDWYYNAVMWAVQNGITGGTSDTTFSPHNSCTRAQVATFLYAARGKPAYDTSASPFTDVSSSDWFYAPVMWAVENDVTGGIGNNQFGPNNPCTRAQVATFLYKADQVEVEEEIGALSNPLPADNDVVIERGNRQFLISCTNVLRGTAANQLAASENSYNDTPGYGQEWRFYEFNVTYVSTTEGDGDYVWGADIISDEQLYSAEGSALSVFDTADMGEQYRGYDVLETSMCMYPGSSTKMVLGVLVSQNAGDVLLRVDNGNEATWIKCDAYSSSLDKNSSGPKTPNDRYINSAANGSITFTYDSAKVSITTAGVITGDAAYKQLNESKPADNQEWRIYKLKVANVSSNSYSYVFVNHLIGNGNFFRTNGVILPWFGDTTLDSDAMYKQLYAGDSVTVSYAILTDKDAGDAMLRVFDGNQTKWLMLGGGSGSSTPGGDSNMPMGEQLAAYVKENGSLNNNGNITVKDSYTVNGNRVDVSVIYSAAGDHLMMDAVINLSTGKFQTSFDYDYKSMKAKTNSIYVHANGSASYPVISYLTKASFDAASYNTNTSLSFTKVSGMNEPYNYVALSNGAVQVSMKAWDMFVEDAIGCGMNELGFDSYTN